MNGFSWIHPEVGLVATYQGAVVEIPLFPQGTQLGGREGTLIVSVRIDVKPFVSSSHGV